MRRSGFTTIEMIIVVAIIGIITLIGFPKIRQTLDKTNLRSARAAVGTLAGTARAAAIQRGCRSALHFAAATNAVLGAAAWPSKGGTVSGGPGLKARVRGTLTAPREPVHNDPRGVSLGG